MFWHSTPLVTIPLRPTPTTDRGHWTRLASRAPRASTGVPNQLSYKAAARTMLIFSGYTLGVVCEKRCARTSPGMRWVDSDPPCRFVQLLQPARPHTLTTIVTTDCGASVPEVIASHQIALVVRHASSRPNGAPSPSFAPYSLYHSALCRCVFRPEPRGPRRERIRGSRRLLQASSLVSRLVCWYLG